MIGDTYNTYMSECVRVCESVLVLGHVFIVHECHVYVCYSFNMIILSSSREFARVPECLSVIERR